MNLPQNIVAAVIRKRKRKLKEIPIIELVKQAKATIPAAMSVPLKGFPNLTKFTAFFFHIIMTSYLYSENI